MKPFVWLLLLMVISCSSFHFASAQVTDFQSWTSIAVEKSFSKKLDGTLEQELRLRYGPVQLNTTFTDASMKYEALKNFDVSLHFRFIVKSTSIAYRPYAECSYNLKGKKWSMEPRIRYQHQFEKNELDENYLRPKVTAGYKINKTWEPYVSGEMFYHVFYYPGDQFDEYRLSGGVTWDADKKNSVKLYYLFQQEFNVNNAERSHVAGAAYKYSF
jgi:hypothetical protein